MAKIVETDNFGRDFPHEKFVENLPYLSEAQAQELADLINRSTGEGCDRFWKVVPDSYVLDDKPIEAQTYVVVTVQIPTEHKAEVIADLTRGIQEDLAAGGLLADVGDTGTWKPTAESRWESSHGFSLSIETVEK